MQHDDQIYLGHMLDNARKAAARINGKTRAEFDSNEDLQIVLAHLIQIIGEAATRVSPAMRQRSPHVPWHRITGMRHRIVHDYMDINADVLWEVATKSLAELIELLQPIVK